MKRYTRLGWPVALNTREMDLNPYFNWRNQLNLENNILLCGNRVVIPSCFQAKVMDVLHSTHIRRYFSYEEFGQAVCVVAED